jgi:SAM-dependent methyltransferase
LENHSTVAKIQAVVHQKQLMAMPDIHFDVSSNLSESQARDVSLQTDLDQRYRDLLALQQAHPDQTFTLPGYSVTAEQPVEFVVDWMYSDGQNINWRERLVCPITGLCNRFRASYHLMTSYLRVQPDEHLYITEQVTPLFQFLQGKFEHIIGSEYIAPDMTPGSHNENGIRHEDLTALSFASNSLDKVFSFDCLEHIVDYQQALRECCRVLKPGGQLVLSVPFDKASHENLVRAVVESDGSITHLTEPDYHGDPLSDAGCLSYYTFGWELLDQMRDLGFDNTHAVHFWSAEYGYLGEEQIVFVGEKSRKTWLSRWFARWFT